MSLTRPRAILKSTFINYNYYPHTTIILAFAFQNTNFFQCRKVAFDGALAHRQSIRHLSAGDCRRFFDEIEDFLLTLNEFRLRHVSVMISDIGSVGGSEDDPVIMPKKREPPKPLAKALTLFNQLLGFFSSSITLKSYAVHSAIRTSNSILYDLPNIDPYFYLAKVLFLSKIRHLFIVSSVI